jgi:hypothetical protein
MNKFAIQTKPLKHNYEVIFQAFTLQKTVKDLWYEVTIIDRQNVQFYVFKN